MTINGIRGNSHRDEQRNDRYNVWRHHDNPVTRQGLSAL